MHRRAPAAQPETRVLLDCPFSAYLFYLAQQPIRSWGQDDCIGASRKKSERRTAIASRSTQAGRHADARWRSNAASRISKNPPPAMVVQPEDPAESTVTYAALWADVPCHWLISACTVDG
jgi:hypothetical protein